MTGSLTRFTALLVLSLFSLGVYAHTTTKVVVIPIFGDDAAAKWRGAWESGIEYKKGDLVYDLGSSYIATSDHISGDNNYPQAPVNDWDLVAEKGGNGIDGADGAIGGAGTAATVSVGTTSTGDAGTNTSVNISGTSSDAVLNFTIPKGDQGDTGAKGDTGDKGDTGNIGQLDQAMLDFLLNKLSALAKTVFVTSTTYEGDLVLEANALNNGTKYGETDGLAAGDALCQDHADAAGILGTYKAWLADSGGNPSNRFSQSTVPYVLVDGTTIAGDWNDLIDGSLDASINLTEAGAAAQSYVWTNVNRFGTREGRDSDCVDWTTLWTDEDEDGGFVEAEGLVGRTSANDYRWTDGEETDSCSKEHPLYCFQQ